MWKISDMKKTEKQWENGSTFSIKMQCIQIWRHVTKIVYFLYINGCNFVHTWHRNTIQVSTDFFFGSDYGYAWPDTIQIWRVSLSFKWRGSHGVAVMHYSCYANGFQFDFHLTDFTFFSFFQAYVLLLRVSLRLGFVFYIYRYAPISLRNAWQRTPWSSFTKCKLALWVVVYWEL